MHWPMVTEWQLCYSKTIVLSWLLLYKISWRDRNYSLLTHIPHWLENIEKEIWERKGEQMTYPTCFRVKIATLWSNQWTMKWQMHVIDTSKACLENLYPGFWIISQGVHLKLRLGITWVRAFDPPMYVLKNHQKFVN